MDLVGTFIEFLEDNCVISLTRLHVRECGVLVARPALVASCLQAVFIYACMYVCVCCVCVCRREGEREGGWGGR